MDQHLPELRNIFSYVISGDEMADVGEYRVKDMTPLLKSRSSADIIIVDTKADRIDDEIFSSITVVEYNGSVSYNN